MNCPSCGTPVIAGQASCACGHYLLTPSPETDMPAQMYTRMQEQEKETSHRNIRQGVLIGTAVLHLFLLIEMAMDSIVIAQNVGVGLLLAFIAAVIGVDIYLLIKRFFM